MRYNTFIGTEEGYEKRQQIRDTDINTHFSVWNQYEMCIRDRYLTEKIHYLKKRLKKFREMTTIKLNKLRKRKKPEESEKEHEKN